MALDAGFAERQIRIAERTGALIAAALEEAVTPLGLPPAEQSATVQRFVRALTELGRDEEAERQRIEAVTRSWICDLGAISGLASE